MLIVLLMSFVVSAEWVEISQNHYRKEPFRNTIQLSDLTTSKNNIYNNYSITEHQWSKGYVDRVSGISDEQQQRIQGAEHKPSGKIERNRFDHKDLTIPDTYKHRIQVNGLKSENSIRNNIRYENRESTASIQRIHETPAKAEHINNKNISRNKLFINKSDRNKHNNDVEIETVNSKKTTTNDAFKIINPNSENLSQTLHIHVTEANEEKFQKKSGEKNSQDKNKIISNNEQRYSMPKEENKRNGTKNNGFDTLLKLIKIVSQTIQKGTRKSFGSKVRYLEDLKMSLLTSIEERIEFAFLDDTVKQRRRRSSSFSDSRGHVEFPSSESALMTISFLTFAVFLIKLVLQVIHTYKAKTMMVTPAVVATVGRAGNILRPHSNN